MALNPYLSVHTNGYATAHNLYESMVIENIQISGQEYYYIPRTLSDRVDQIFGEDVLSSFNSYAKIEMYLDNINSYGGESEMLSKFAYEIRDTASFTISRKRFTETVIPIVPIDRNEALKWRPCEGDLIFAPISQSLWEIKFVEDEDPFYQLSKKFVWKLRCELVQLNNEKFNTGLTVVDETFNRNYDRLNYGILTEDGYTFVFEGKGGDFIQEEYDSSTPFDDMTGYGDNNAIKQEFMDIMDFSEDNPFNERF